MRTTTTKTAMAMWVTVIEGRSSRFGNWETLPEGTFEGPTQDRDARDAFESLMAMGEDYRRGNTRLRTFEVPACVTAEDLAELAVEAGAAGDGAMVRICADAIEGSPAAIRRCAEVICRARGEAAK